MKLLSLLPILSFLFITQANVLFAAEPVAVICTFLSPLRYTGTQWKIRCENAPVYLARWENNSWKVLALFDGTGGKYRLEWEKPAPGIYAACDSFGRTSETIQIGTGR